MIPKITSILNSKITLYIIIGLAAYFIFDLYHDNKALEASKEVWEEKAEAREKVLLSRIDSLKNIDNQKSEEIEQQDEKIARLLEDYNYFINNMPNEKAVDNMRDTDSIAELFARVYSDHD